MSPALSRLRALFDLMKAEQGPFIGPRGGKWADAKHTIPWRRHHARGYNAAARGTGTVGVSNHQVRILARNLAARWEQWKRKGKPEDQLPTAWATVHTATGIRRIAVVIEQERRGETNLGVAGGSTNVTPESLGAWLQKREEFFRARGLKPVPWVTDWNDRVGGESDPLSPDYWGRDPARRQAVDDFERLHPRMSHFRYRYEPNRVILYVNRYANLQDPRTLQRLRSTLAHELTHVIDFWPSKSGGSQSQEAAPGTDEWWDEYINRPEEVRAWMREVYRDMNTPEVAEAVRQLPHLAEPDVKRLLREHSPSNYVVMETRLSDHNWRRLLSKMSRLLLQHRDGTSVPLEKAGYYQGER